MQHRVINFDTSKLRGYNTPEGLEGKHVNACEFLNGLYLHFMKVGEFESALECAYEAYRLNPKFAMLVGSLLERGVIKSYSPYTHIHYYYTAAMQGEPQAYNSLGKCFLFGKGVAVNYFYAQLYFSIACNYQIPESGYYLGYLHQCVFFLPGCFDIAFKYYAQSHILGCALGTRALAQCYEYGVNGTINMYEALELYHDADFKKGTLGNKSVDVRRLEALISPKQFNNYLRNEHGTLVTLLYAHRNVFRTCSDKEYMLLQIKEDLLNISKVLKPAESIDDFLRQAYSTVLSL